MQFQVATLLTLAISVLAAPQGGALGGLTGSLTGGLTGSGGKSGGSESGAKTIPTPGNDVTVGQAGDTCGSNFDLSCCNKVDQSGDSVNEASGLLAGLLSGTLENGDVGLFDGCSKLDVAAVIGIDDLLNSQCKQTAACCQHSGTSQDGLVNVGLPCVALGGLL
ncbi:hypothetical protein F4779DRAFT_597925 [Xylariaceae sp. FL0662B]|nr:hypothetical protein F4779DRAFT_597925 [Xylariaceae sp. FL0662B]